MNFMDSDYLFSLDAESVESDAESTSSNEPTVQQVPPEEIPILSSVCFKTASILWSQDWSDRPDTPDPDLNAYYEAPTSTESRGVDIIVHDQSGQRLISIPLQFYLTGHVGQDYILDMVHVTFEEHGTLRCPEIDASNPPTSSIRVTFIRDDRLKLPCRARIGPRFRFPYGLATNDDLHEVWKAENPHDPWEADYLDEADGSVHLEKLWKRDRKCLIASDPDSCDPLRIVPPPLSQEVVDDAGLAEFPSVPLPNHLPQAASDHPSAFILIGALSERLWSTGRIALYPLPGAKASYVVHSFYYHPEMAQCHGKVITRARFRCRRDEDLPDPELLKYHYAQCAMKMLRGYGYGHVPPNARDIQWNPDQLLGGPRR